MADKQTKLSQFQADVVASATEAIAQHATPQYLRACIQEIIEDILKKVASGDYSSLKSLVQKHIEQAAQRYLDTDEAKGMISNAAVAGVREALKGMPEQVKGKVIDTALKGMIKSLSSNSRY